MFGRGIACARQIAPFRHSYSVVLAVVLASLLAGQPPAVARAATDGSTVSGAAAASSAPSQVELPDWLQQGGTGRASRATPRTTDARWNSGRSGQPELGTALASVPTRLILATILLAVTLGITLIWLRPRGKTASGRFTSGSPQIISSLKISPHCALHLVQLDRHRVIVGVDRSGIRELSIVPDAFVDLLEPTDSQAAAPTAVAQRGPESQSTVSRSRSADPSQVARSTASPPGSVPRSTLFSRTEG